MKRDDTTGDALRYLAQHGQSPSKDIARAVGWGSRTAGAKMAGLEKQGLVSRVKVRQQTARSDARYEWLLTARGSELCRFVAGTDERTRLEAERDRAVAMAQAFNAQLAAKGAELAALREVAQAVVDHAEDARRVFADELIVGAVVLRPETLAALRAALASTNESDGSEG